MHRLQPHPYTADAALGQAGLKAQQMLENEGVTRGTQAAVLQLTQHRKKKQFQVCRTYKDRNGQPPQEIAGCTLPRLWLAASYLQDTCQHVPYGARAQVWER